MLAKVSLFIIAALACWR